MEKMTARPTRNTFRHFIGRYSIGTSREMRDTIQWLAGESAHLGTRSQVTANLVNQDLQPGIMAPQIVTLTARTVSR